MEKTFTYAVATSLLAFVPLWGGAVEPYKPVMADPLLEPWRWQQEEALDDLGVLCMDEGPDGTLWFGSVGSIARYDGVTITKIDFSEKLLSRISYAQKLPWAKALRVLPDDELLVLIGRSLVLRTGSEWRVIIQDVGRSEFTARLEQADDGTFWLLVPQGLWRISQDLAEYSQVIAASDNHILGSFCIDVSGDLWVVDKWIGSGTRLIRIPLPDGLPGETREIFNAPNHSDYGSSCIAACPDGTLLYATSDQADGLQLFDPASGRWERQGDDPRMRDHFSLMKGRDGTIWAGMEGKIGRWTPDHKLLEYPELKFELPPLPLSMFEASNGRIWIIGRIGQVCSVDMNSSEWMTYVDLNYDFETDEGIQWFRSGNSRKVVSHDTKSGEWKEYGPEDGLMDRPRALFHSSLGLVWAAGNHKSHAAVAVFDGSRWNLNIHAEFANELYPNGVFEAEDGTVWFGAQGLQLIDIPHAGGALQYRVNPDRSVELLRHHAPPDFPYYVTAFAQTPDQTLWLGSTVIHSIDPASTVRLFPEIQGENTVAMTLDSTRTLWAAKEHFGVCRWNGSAWNIFTQKDGLPDLKLCDMLVLKDESLMVSSSKGISRFDGKNWTAHIYPECFSMSSRRSSLRQSPDEAIWFNYVNSERKMKEIVTPSVGCCAIRHRPESSPPDTRFVEFLKRVAHPGNTLITWTAQDPWNRTPRNQLQYSWRLDGEEWTPFSYETSKTFLSLESGSHQLEVRARDRAFNVDPTPARVEFYVVAPLWLQPWFVGMVLLMVGGTMAFIWTMIHVHDKHLKDRARHLSEIDQLKTSFFTNVSHELRTPLSVMLGPLESVFNSETDDIKRQKLSMSIRSARRVSTLLTQLLDFQKIEQGKMAMEFTQGDIAAAVRETVELLQPMAQLHQVSCQLECVGDCYGMFDQDKLSKMVSNLVGNAIKYTHAGGKVRVKLGTVPDPEGRNMLSLVVEDSGRGIAPDQLQRIFDRFYRLPEIAQEDGSGIGLNLTKELVDLWGGNIRAESPIHEDAKRPGTRFIVHLPIDPDHLVKKGMRNEES